MDTRYQILFRRSSTWMPDFIQVKQYMDTRFYSGGAVHGYQMPDFIQEEHCWIPDTRYQIPDTGYLDTWILGYLVTRIPEYHDF